jgi:hypothetical protein
MKSIRAWFSQNIILKNILAVIIAMILGPIAIYAFLIVWITLGLYFETY